MLVESISFGGVGRDSGACNSCLGAESVLAGGWRLSLLTAVAVCSHHREALASPDVPGITHILNGGGDCWYPFFLFWGLTTGALWEGALKSIPLHKGPFWMGIPWILPASPPPPPQTTLTAPRWVCHTGILCFRPKSSQRWPAVRSQGGYEALSLCSQASLLLYPQRGHCSLRSCRGLYRADRQKTHPAFWFVSESWRINNSLRCQSLSAKIWILKWNLRATTATVVG